VMSLFWMAVVAAVIFVEKLVPQGERLVRVFGVALIALGVWVASAPASVPGLVQPDSHGADLARMRMMGMKPGLEPMQKMNPAPAMDKPMQETNPAPGMKMR
jgi:Predicted metal-binding integral membrane protein (DUF2182)